MRHFKAWEFACKCGCGENHMDAVFLEMLDKAREYAGTPFIITSGYRCEKYNAHVGGKADSAHLTGHAADIATPNSVIRFKVMKGLLQAGFTRIGYDARRKFLHVDNDPEKPQGVIFDY